ncbi:large conductance mechanosensitive channel protein MscL [Corynebacterium pseudodiphtheriticum]|uniref:large conductance mechanosensitive channel protein MscL n=1 Tax=Corynebacterium pseudodiphtheriticum TaxID=37637 RepID=UPI00201BD4A5|nr:large conductance mechanosensitive channel protein MscL [Corynebacterium pseudodiphtheriticum]UQV58821.1 large conductance mechanosensitive channel protein MscL [Corynebacterium pseudodiphtheriticum]
MLQGFKEFIMRGNVIELSTAVIIGSAFTAIVTSVSDHIINPLIASFGSADVSGLGFHVNPNNEATFLDFGAVITAVINFFIVASIVYFLIIMPINKLEKARKRSLGIGSDDDKDPAATTEELLAEIRDLLRDHTPTNSQATESETRKDQ